MNVRKFDGSKQQFDRNRIIHTCLRNGASEDSARKIADSIASDLYEGMATREILELVWSHLGRHHPESLARIDLRMALSILSSKPDFENYVSLILRNLGYTVQSNRVLRGKCVEHEIDAIAQKESRTYYVEIKHHRRAHTYTSLDVPMKVWATLQDLAEGKKLGHHNISFTNSLILCNTKFTNHARTYADCVGIDHIAWKSPAPNGLENIIERNGLYPVTLLRDVDRRLQRTLIDNGILLLRQLSGEDADILIEKRKISANQVSLLRNKSRRILNLAEKRGRIAST
jgi:hypothetical protein